MTSVRRRRADKARRYARSCYTASCQFVDESSPVNAANDLAFINRFQQFVFDFSDSSQFDGTQDSGLVSKHKRSPSLLAHEDALRAATPLPDARSSGQRSTNSNNKVGVDD